MANKRVHVVALIAIRRNRMLFVRQGGVWLLPGGTQEKREGRKKCLTREIKEELGARVRIGGFYKSFDGKTERSDRPMTLWTYFGEIGNIAVKSSDIESLKWARPPKRGLSPISGIGKSVLRSLKKDHLIKKM